jgi:HAD superfamily hydrolase (TIGR01549 family)
MALLECVIFDLDHTLVDSDLDFDQMKREIGTTMPILEYRDSVDAADKARVDAILDRHEELAAATCNYCEGARELLDYLAEHNVRSALLTRNTQKSIAHVCERLGMKFEMALSREDSEPKPSPLPILEICEALGVLPSRTMMVGDFLYDMESGAGAGAMTMLVDSFHRHTFEFTPDYEVSTLRDAIPIVDGLLKNGEKTE